MLLLSCGAPDDTTGTKGAAQKADEEPTTIDLPWPEEESEAWDAQQCGSSTYPCPPYGLKLYQRLEEFPFIPVGDSAGILANEAGMATLRDLYTLKDQGYKLLLLNISTGWCGYCSAQAGVISGSIADAYEGEVAFLSVVVQDEYGADATLNYAESYMNSKNLDGFDNVFVTYDPAGLFQRYMNIAAFPFNAWIDLENMELIGYQGTMMSFTDFSSAISIQMGKLKK